MRFSMSGYGFTASRLHGFTASRLHGFTASRLHGFTVSGRVVAAAALLFLLTHSLPAQTTEPDPALVTAFAEYYAGRAPEPEAEPTLPVIDGAAQQLQSAGESAAVLQRAQIGRADFFREQRHDRFGAFAEYQKAAAAPYPTDTPGAAEAKIAMAELVPGGFFTGSVRLCNEVLAAFPALPQDLRNRCLLTLALSQYQLEDETTARTTFEQLLTSSPDTTTALTVRRHLDGMADPESSSAIAILCDRAERRIATECAVDEAFWDSQRILKLAERPFFAAYLADSDIDPEERAETLYRVSFSRFLSGYGAQALELALRALTELQPPAHGLARAKCRYMIAYMLGRTGKWTESEAEWRALIDSSPPGDLLPEAYMEWSRARHLSGDPLGAIFTLEELKVRFPSRKEIDTAQIRIREILRREPALRSDYDTQAPEIIARAEIKWGKPRMMATPPVKPEATPAPQIAGIGGAE